MRYLNKEHLLEIGVDWGEAFEIVQSGLKCLVKNDFAQPLKPYLRFNEPENRIIAMPAYLGGSVRKAGIKWIASFPANVKNNRQRAHSVTILNDSQNGVPLCVINSNLISGIRTAAVSGLMLREYLRWTGRGKLTLGVIGFGPIGILHLEMALESFSDKINKVVIYDSKKDVEENLPTKYKNLKWISFVYSWEEAYDNSDIVMTCTVSKEPYVGKPPRKGSLHLNISLRDYKAELRKYMDMIIVDDWEEVCRENTDVERMYKFNGLRKEDTIDLATATLTSRASKVVSVDSTVMFNPMGMAIFDIAFGNAYYQKAEQRNIGILLPD